MSSLFSIFNKGVHYGIYFSIFLSPFVPKRYMYFYLGFQLITVYHWYLFNGQCVITLFQNKLDNTNTTLTGHIFQYFQLPLYTYDIIYHTSLLYSFYRLNAPIEGVLNTIIILSLNNLIYNHYSFKW